MKRIRYLSLLTLLLCGVSAWAQGGFNPSDPPEPGRIPYKLALIADPADGGSVYGGGNYITGTTVNIAASSAANYRFVNWTDDSGTVISTESSFDFVKAGMEEHLTAHFAFDPGTPAEPGNDNVYYYLTLAAEEGGSTSGNGRYTAGTSVNIYAYANERYVFAGWYDEDNRLLSTEAEYTIVTEARPMRLLARFDYNPPSPTEPLELNTLHRIKLKAQEGGTVGADKYWVSEGESTMIRAYANSGYDFKGWYQNGKLYTALNEFSYTMGTTDAIFEAHFEFNPGGPSEPEMPDTKKYAFYMMNIVGKPGSTVQFPVYLTSLTDCRDMTFQLTFNKLLLPNFSSAVLSAAAKGYTLSYANGTVEEGHDELAAYVVSLVGGKTTAGNNALLTFDISIPSDMKTGQSYPVTINQVSVMNLDLTTQTASTRNGRVSVYKEGDANGDDIVDVADIATIISVMAGEYVEDYVKIMCDVNDDGNVDVADISSVIDIMAAGSRIGKSM
jgi:hypothetical protein